MFKIDKYTADQQKHNLSHFGEKYILSLHSLGLQVYEF